MQQTPDTEKELSKVMTQAPVVAMTEATPEPISPAHELSTLLGRAGELAASMGMELETWMRTAWGAFVDARPGLREHLEEMQLLAQLTELRQRGRIGQA